MAEHSILFPNEGIRRSVKNGLVMGPLAGLLAGLAIGLVFGLPNGLVFGLVMGLVFGLAFGVHLGLGAAVQHYILRLWLWRTRFFPWKAVSFLEDATARILLRRVGGGYSFVHRLILDYFADLEPTALTAAATQPPPA